MRVRTPGKVRDRLWLLGREESCVYLVEGDKESILINGGMSYLIPDLLQQFEAFGIDETRITKVLILHAHFDHVGIAPFFKRRNQEIEICASKRGWKILQMPQAIATINQFSRDVAKKMGYEVVYDSFDLDWDEGTTGTVLAEGDRIDLGGVELKIYETPGHSSCSITAYSPQLKALFASDAGGIPFKMMILTSGNSHYTNYQLSLEKIKDFDVDRERSLLVGDKDSDIQAGFNAGIRYNILFTSNIRTNRVREKATAIVDDLGKIEKLLDDIRKS